MTEMNTRPLTGVRVVELATFIAAPCCARYLADLGADVIKVERPRGDDLRYTAVNEGRPFGDAEDTSFTLENTGKRCITLDTKSAAGREALEKLIAQSDVFLTNWRQPALERAALDYESLKAKYPKLVYGIVSGYGEKGPDKDLPGFDFTAYFAHSGVMGTLYDRDSEPMLPLAGFGDHQVAMSLASGVIAALYRAEKTGRGDKVVVSLYHSGVWDVSLYLIASQYGDASTQYPIRKAELTNPLNSARKTADGRWFMFSLPAYDKLFNRFVKDALGREDLVNDPRFYPQTNLVNGHLDEWDEIFNAEVASHDVQYWIAQMKKADLPYAVCQTWDEILRDEQAYASDILTDVEFPNGMKRTMVRTPVMFQDTELPAYRPAHFLGQDTREVLAQLGYSQEQIDAMIAAGEATDTVRIG
ncbi:MAG: CoA transferase [Solobacterium sp.]|nr:CoA transferase [Solobacterium sp.]MBQ1320140.1 CoA transferase [Solobacterium sp.]MBQ1355631.1 CoA transferase [Solobacterium sp.]